MISEILSRPFPANAGLKNRWLSSLTFGVFVFLFLWIFQPFGLSTLPGSIGLFALGYGLITLFCMLIMQIGVVHLFPKFYQEEKWNVGGELSHTLSTVLLVAFGNFIFSAWLGFFQFNTKVFFLFLGFTLAVGFFPVIIQILIRQNLHQKENLRRSKLYSQGIKIAGPSPEKTIELKDQEGRVELRLRVSFILVFESADNYVQVFYQENGSLKKMLVRNTLKYYEQQFTGLFFRCHRSFLVNLENVKEVKGNARGFSLFIHPDLKEIPVARRQVDAFSLLVGRRGR